MKFFQMKYIDVIRFFQKELNADDIVVYCDYIFECID